jgi:hypothetical protein
MDTLQRFSGGRSEAANIPADTPARAPKLAQGSLPNSGPSVSRPDKSPGRPHLSLETEVDPPPLVREVKEFLGAGAGSAAPLSASPLNQLRPRPLLQLDDGGRVDPEVIPPQYNPAWANERSKST